MISTLVCVIDVLAADEGHTIHTTKPGSDTALLALVSLGAQQVSSRVIPPHHLALLVLGLAPEAGAVDAELADDAAGLETAIAQDGVAHGRRRDQLHEDVRAPVLLGPRPQKVGDRRPVHVVAAALALRLEHVPLALLRVERQLARLQARRRAVERVDVGEGRLEVLEGEVRRRRQEAVQDGRLRRAAAGRREDLLHLLGARDLRQHRGALDRGRPLQLVPRLPGLLARVVAGAVAAAHVDDADLESEVGQLRWRVQELAALAVGDLGVLEDLGEGQPKHGDGLRRGRDLVLEMLLVEDVALAVLGQEDDALAAATRGLAVRRVRLHDALREALGAVVVGQRGGALDHGRREQAVLDGREVAVQRRRLGRQPAERRGDGVELDLLDLRRRV